jgi:LysM repeat protein
MAMTSTAEARFDARVRPGIDAMRARTAYPRRRPATATAQLTSRLPSGLAPASTAPDSTAPASTAPAGLIRLTRRGRLLAAMLVTVCTVAAISLLWLGLARGAHAASGTPVPRPAGQAMSRVVVRPGQTLWAIAAQADPSADPRAIIGEIMQVNALDGTVVQPGQVLWVPRG